MECWYREEKEWSVHEGEEDIVEALKTWRIKGKCGGMNVVERWKWERW